jgi:hypothetical protein
MGAGSLSVRKNFRSNLHPKGVRLVFLS